MLYHQTKLKANKSSPHMRITLERMQFCFIKIQMHAENDCIRYRVRGMEVEGTAQKSFKRSVGIGK
uniref:Uncharacterized protein n=1 Tax=Wuchereria bancrofti TaxID=6293 RepID=A0AAF5RXZ2_WUCBA